MKVLYAVYPVRVVFGLVGIALVHWAPADLNDFSQWSTNVYYVTAMAVSIAQAGFMQAMFVPQMSFFSLVSDPSMGGTYMTVLNTLSNVGSNLGGQWALRSVDLLAEWGWDGFYASTCLNVALGLLWWFVLGPKLLTLDKTGIKAWKVKRESRVMKTL
jgi:PAT family acetyl-CoA transporter-like MFS transporter 1